MGVDMGAEWFKVAAVSTGSGVVDIVLNDQSNRKTPTYIGFRNGDRYFGHDAQSLAPRFPSNFPTFICLLLGQPKTNVELQHLLKDKLHLPFDFVADERRGTIGLKIGDNVYSPEEIVGMWFNRLKQYAEKYSEQSISEVVVAIPSSFNARQRQAVIDAAKLGGLNVLSLMDHTTAAALQFGVQNRGFPNGRKVVIVDYGAASLEVGVFEFDPIPNTKKKHGDVLGTLHVKSIVGDQYNGGRHMDALLAEIIAAKFKGEKGVDLMPLDDNNARRAKVKLMRTAQKAKEMLSANKEAKLTVEGLWEEQDFPFRISRAEYEEVIQVLVDRAMGTVREAVRRSGYSLDTIDSVELMGGNSRVPLFQERLGKIFKSVGRSLNTDEATATGAAFHSARLSGGWKVRGFGLSLRSSVNISFQLSPTSSVPSPAPRPLFTMAQLPSRKVVQIKRLDDFNATLFNVDRSDSEEKYIPVDEYHFGQIRGALTRMQYFINDTVNPRSNSSIEIKFHLSESGLTSIHSFVVAVTEVPLPTENVTNPLPIRRTRTLEPNVSHILLPKPMSPDIEKKSREVLQKLDRAERQKFKNGEERNKLDQMIYNMKHDDKFSKIREADDGKLSQILEEMESWLSGSGAEAKAKECKEKQNQLKAMAESLKLTPKKEKEEKKETIERNEEEGSSPPDSAQGGQLDLSSKVDDKAAIKLEESESEKGDDEGLTNDL